MATLKICEAKRCSDWRGMEGGSIFVVDADDCTIE